MNQITYGALRAVPTAARPNQRALAKQRTREKIVAAAKSLFAERGYEGATIRDIAKLAGMSTGAVFASFTDKSDLFTEIAETEQSELLAAMREAGESLSGRKAIYAMLEAAAERHMAELALFQAVMSALWTPGLADRIRRRLDRRPAIALILAAVRQDFGCEAQNVDCNLVAELIWDGYAATLRRAALDGLTLEAVKTRVNEATRAVLAGTRRG
ncbi:MAG TPA: TetR family transcriptional regulator [Caulobacteraceae bacterium]|nr:TetR family transcriptional regulator [Caulobacteraceae bacterium]